MSKRILFALSFFVLFSLSGVVTPVSAQLASPSATLVATDGASATESATATDSATATISATIAPIVTEKKEKDITETTPKTQDKLVEFLNQHPIGGLSWYNPLQVGIRRAIQNGIPANIIVLILLFPVITAVISLARHIIGLKGFGIYTPAVLSVAFLSTGILNGIVLFLVTLVASTIMKKLLRRLKLQYLPRTAMMLWGVSVFMILILIGLSFLPFPVIFTIGIFPILIIMLLTEDFLGSQLAGSQSEARQLTIETLIIAVVCSVIIGYEPLQQFVLLQPELTLIVVAAINMLVGRYTGLRFMEWLRFRTIITN
ncbi:hypothetical protein H3C66_04675 [Patescibacteria group bacterium]|nr:hypothetical protein [Patescibacteria group bacterium]